MPTEIGIRRLDSLRTEMLQGLRDSDARVVNPPTIALIPNRDDGFL